MKDFNAMTTREMILFGAVVILASTSIGLFINTLNPWHGPGPRPMHAFMAPPPGEGQWQGKRHGGKDFGERMMLRADTNKDGFLTKEEMIESNRTFVERMFAESDTDKDGKLSPQEMKEGRERLRAKMMAGKAAATPPEAPAAQ